MGQIVLLECLFSTQSHEVTKVYLMRVFGEKENNLWQRELSI